MALGNIRPWEYHDPVPLFSGPRSSLLNFAKVFENPSGHGRPRRKSWTSAPSSGFPCGPVKERNFLTPRAFGWKGQECPQEIRAKKFIFMLLFFADLQLLLLHSSAMSIDSGQWVAAHLSSVLVSSCRHPIVRALS